MMVACCSFETGLMFYKLCVCVVCFTVSVSCLVAWIFLFVAPCAVFLGSFFFFSGRRRHTRSLCDWSSDVCSSDLGVLLAFRERSGLRFELLRALDRFDGRPFKFPLFLRASSLLRGGVFLRTLEIVAPPVEFDGLLLEGLRGLGRLEFLLLERRFDGVQGGLPLRERRRSVFHARGRLREVRKFLLELPLGTDGFGLPGSERLLSGYGHLLPVRDGLDAFFQLLGLDFGLLFNGRQVRLIPREFLQGGPEFAGLDGHLLGGRLLDLPLRFEILRGLGDLVVFPGKLLAALGEPRF